MITASVTHYVNMSERLLNIRNRYFLAPDTILLAPLAALALRADEVFALCCALCHDPGSPPGRGPHRAPAYLLQHGHAPARLPG